MPHLSRSTWPRWARTATSPWLVSPIVVFALLAGAYVGYGVWTRSQPTHYARGGDAFASLVPTHGSAAARARAHGTPPRKGVAKATKTNHAGDRAAGSVSDPGATNATGSTHHTAASGQSTSGAQTSRSGQRTSSGVVAPSTGTYQLAVNGSEHVRFGPFSACSNSFPTSSQLVVQPAAGEPSGSYDFDLRFYPNNANRHDERHIYRYTNAGVFLSYEQATVTCGGVKQSSTVNYSPLQQRVRAPLSNGEKWSDNGGDGARTEKGTSTVVGTTTITVQGHSYLTWVIDTHLTMTGDESGTRDQRWWWSPALGVPLKWHESLSGKRSGATYSENVTVSVVGLP